MTDLGIGAQNSRVRPFIQNGPRTGGGQTGPVSKGGKTSDPAGIGSVTSEATPQQSSRAVAPDVQTSGGGGVSTPSPDGIGPGKVGTPGKGKNIDVLS